MKPTDIASPAEWQNIQSLFSMVTGLTSVTFDLDGNPVAPPEFQNEFCRAFKGTETGTKYCRESHLEITERVLRTGKPEVSKCRAGFVKVVVPIYYNGEIIGVTGGCGVFLKTEGLDVEKLVSVAADAGLDESTVRQLAETIKGIDNTTIEEEISLLQAKLDALLTSR